MLKSLSAKIKIQDLLIPIALITILPFIILNLYNHPCADDFFFFGRAEKVGFINALKSLYNLWSGRIFSHSQLLLFPLISKSFEGYKLFSLFFMILFFCVLYFFVFEFSGNKLSKKEVLIISFSVFFLYLYKMRVVSQGFYWITSVIVYHNTILLLLLFLISYHRLIVSNNNFPKIIYTLVSCFLAFAVCTSNEVGMMILFIIVFLFLLSNSSKKNWSWSLFFIIISVIIASYIDMASPGTIQREGHFTGNKNFNFSFVSSFKEMSYYLLSWSILSPLIPVTFLLLPFLSKLTDGENSFQKYFKVSPLLILITGGFIIYSGFFIAYYGLGTVFGRTINFFYFIYLIIWFYFIITLIFYTKEKYKFTLNKIPKYLYTISFVILLLYLIRASNITIAYEDLLSGKAKEYDAQMINRYNAIKESSSDTLVVENINNVPASFYLFDITIDPENINNLWFSKYFNKKSIYRK